MGPVLHLHCAGRVELGLAGPALGLVLAPARQLLRWNRVPVQAGPVPLHSAFESRSLLWGSPVAYVLNTVRGLLAPMRIWPHVSAFDRLSCFYASTGIYVCVTVWPLASSHTGDEQ